MPNGKLIKKKKKEEYEVVKEWHELEEKDFINN